MLPPFLYSALIGRGVMKEINCPPHGWADNNISTFIDASRLNEYATFANKSIYIDKLTKIDKVFRLACELLSSTEKDLINIFLLRAHSNYLASCRLSWSGQHPESFALLRSCLEHSLYAVYFFKYPHLQETWGKRHDNEAAKKTVKKQLKITDMIALAEGINKSRGKEAKALYELTIDMGAHPNLFSIIQTVRFSECRNDVDYLSSNQDNLDYSLGVSIRVGVCVLSLFELIYSNRFSIMGLSDILLELRCEVNT